MSNVRKYSDKAFRPSDLYDHCSIKQVKLSEFLYTILYIKMAILSRTLKIFAGNL
jgi:hypothetical protein